MKTLIAIAATVALMGCANHTPRHMVDTKGVDMARYYADTAECNQYAAQVDVGGSTAQGAIGGALIGAIVGGLIGGKDGAVFGAKVFGVTGAAEGAGSAMQDKKAVAVRCMQGRGYKVLL